MESYGSSSQMAFLILPMTSVGCSGYEHGDHLSVKPGNVRELTEKSGIVQEKILSERTIYC